MKIIEATNTCLRKYFQRSGRASRAEYWWFYLATVLALIVATIIDALLFGLPTDANEAGATKVILWLLLIIPNFTASVRRLHDTGRSGYYLFAPLLGCIIAIFVGKIIGPAIGQGGPIIVGIIIILSFLFPVWWQTRPSDPNHNTFGPNPHEALS